MGSRDSGGYRLVNLKDGERYRFERAHRLVAVAFHGAPPSADHQVDHLNGDRSNDRAENLEWVTPQENVSRAIGGVRHHHAKLDPESVRQIRAAVGAGEKMLHVAKRYAVNSGTVYNIINGRSWKDVK